MGNSGGGGPSPFGGMGDYMDVDDQPGTPFSFTSSGPSHPRRSKTNSTGFGGSGGFPGAFPSSGGPGSRKRANSFSATSTDEAEKAAEIVKPLKLTLEELYKGTTKKLKLTRKLLNGQQEEKVVEINVSNHLTLMRFLFFHTC